MKFRASTIGIWFLIVYAIYGNHQSDLVHSEMMSSHQHCIAAKRALDRELKYRVRVICEEMSADDLPKLDSDQKRKLRRP